MVSLAKHTAQNIHSYQAALFICVFLVCAMRSRCAASQVSRSTRVSPDIINNAVRSSLKKNVRGVGVKQLSSCVPRRCVERVRKRAKPARRRARFSDFFFFSAFLLYLLFSSESTAVCYFILF